MGFMRTGIKFKKISVLAGIMLSVPALCMSLYGCGQAAAGSDSLTKIMETSTIFAMDTVMELQVYGDAALLTEAEQKIRSLENAVSVTKEDSDIGILNKEKTSIFSEETAELMDRALSICERTEGALDISIYPVVKAWGFTTGEYAVPSEKDLDALLENVDYTKIVFENDSIGAVCNIPDGMQIDLGSVAKGYTSSMIYDYFKDNGIESGLINLGGNVQCIGTKPNGDSWKVAIKSPFMDSASGIFGVLKAADVAVITSGGYERYFEQDGEIYWHIIDPENGKPADNGLVSVTIVGKDGCLCDGLSTALFVMGLDEAVDFWQKSDDFDAIFIAEDGSAYITEGIADSFTLSSEYYDTEITVIHR